MLAFLLAILMLMSTGSASTVAKAANADKPVVATWLWSSDLVSQGVENTMQQLAGTGFTDVYLLCKGTKGTVIWDTQWEDAAEAYEYDLLDKALTSATARGIRLHAWIMVGRDDHYVAHHPGSNLSHFLYGYGSTAKCSAACTGSCNPNYDPNAGVAWVNLRNEEYLDYMRFLVEELCVKYPDLAGIRLDSIRYGSLSYDWGADTYEELKTYGITRTQYNEAVRAMCVSLGKNTYTTKTENGLRVYAPNGKVESGTSFSAALTATTSYAVNKGTKLIADFRKNTVNAAMETLYSTAKKHGMPMSADIMPDTVEGIYDRAVYGQYPVAMSACCDVICIMSYAEAYGKGVNYAANCAKVLAGKLGNNSSKGVIAGIQFYTEEGCARPTSKNIFAQIQNVMTARSKDPNLLGYATFHYGCGVHAGAMLKTNAKTGATSITLRLHNSQGVGTKTVNKILIDMQGSTKATKVNLDSRMTGWSASISADGKTITLTGKEFPKITGNLSLTIAYTGSATASYSPCCVRAFSGSSYHYTLCNPIY